MERWGTDIEVVLADNPAKPPEADLAVLHVDLTVVPSEYLAMAARYPICLNRFTADISKRVVSRHLVKRGDGFRGPVIVKSNLNYGGRKEAAKGILPKALGQRLSEGYLIFESSSEVPDEFWTDGGVIVEKYMPEVDAGRHCVRYWLFLGSREIVVRLFSTEGVVKSVNATGRERLDGVPEELRELRDELGFDYGKFDFGVVDGKAVLYDANRTPGLGKLTQEQLLERAEAMQSGIWDFVERPCGDRVEFQIEENTMLRTHR